jgi:hypothetical protein
MFIINFNIILLYKEIYLILRLGKKKIIINNFNLILGRNFEI